MQFRNTQLKIATLTTSVSWYVQWHSEPTRPGSAILPDVFSRLGLEEQIPD